MHCLCRSFSLVGFPGDDLYHQITVFRLTIQWKLRDFVHFNGTITISKLAKQINI